MPFPHRPYDDYSLSVSERLEAGGCPEAITGCILWTRGLNKWGYGQIQVNKQRYAAHRLAWENHHGRKAPSGRRVVVMHRCDNRACINPDHLELGTQSQNIQDAIDRGGLRYLRGEGNHAAKLTAEDVRWIRSRPMSIRAMSLHFGVWHSTIESILSGRSWGHLR